MTGVDVREVGTRCFGASLYDQGRGFYVTLELLAIIWGTRARDSNAQLLPSPSEVETLVYLRRSHDFARRLAAEVQVSDVDLQRIGGDVGGEVIGDLMSAVSVPIPNRRTSPDWPGVHLTPSIGELIHYDAVKRRREGLTVPVLERYTYRGAGGLAHKMLRTDADEERLKQTRESFDRLVTEQGGPLGRLAEALTRNDAASAAPFEDREEAAAEPLDAVSRWPEILRSGVANLLAHEMPGEAAVQRLMHFIPYCIARHQSDVADSRLGQKPPPTVLDFGDGPSAIRRSSHSNLLRAKRAIVDALESTAASENGDQTPTYESMHRWRFQRGFFTTTLATIGALNAFGGRQHFTLRLPLLEAIVAATVGPAERISYEAFCTDVLHGQCRTDSRRFVCGGSWSLGGRRRRRLRPKCPAVVGQPQVVGSGRRVQ